MHSKNLRDVEVKNADKGEVSAVIATLNVKDKDGDVSTADTFEDGAEVLVSAYGHASWSGALPVGKGSIHVTPSEVLLDAKFFLDTTAGRDTFQVVKQLGVKQEWSYGYDVLEAERGVFDGEDVQFLKRVKVHEASPVLVGAGVNTRTLSAKGAPTTSSTANGVIAIEQQRGRAVSEYRAAVRPHETRTTPKQWSSAEAVALLGDLPTIADLRSVFAWCDPDGDPEVKASYKFAHHHGPGGPANLRACLVGIAKLNGAADGPGIPEADRRGVYNHLAQHISDADREVPELRPPGYAGPLKFIDEGAAALAVISAFRERGTGVMALRRSKSKSISAGSSELLEWSYDEVRAFQSLLDTPQDDAARELARFILHQLQNNDQGE